MSINVTVSGGSSINVTTSSSNLLNLSAQGYTLHANTHENGGVDPINHNLLRSIQGGQSNEYYHLTSGQYINLNNIISSTGTYTLHSETGAFYASSNPSGFITGINNIVYTTGNQNISGTKNFYIRPTVNGSGVLLDGEAQTSDYVNNISGNLQGQIITLNNQTGSYYLRSNPSGFITGVDLAGYATTSYVTGASGVLQTQITTLNDNTGTYYPRTNPSGYLTALSNIVYATGNQTISGIKTFATGVDISGNLTISGTYNIYQEIEKSKILAIAYAIAL